MLLLENLIDNFPSIELSNALCQANSNCPSSILFFKGSIFLSCSKSINELLTSTLLPYKGSSDFSFKMLKLPVKALESLNLLYSL
jgi:hypothetical protein